MTDYKEQGATIQRSLLEYCRGISGSDQSVSERVGLSRSRVRSSRVAAEGLSIPQFLEICDAYGLDASEVLKWDGPPATFTVNGKTYRLAD